METQVAALKDLQARAWPNQANRRPVTAYAKPKRTTSLRQPGQKPQGSQPGYRGDTLERVAAPDHTEVHPVVAYAECGASLADVAATTHDERQVFDIPAILIEVTAHWAEVKTCPGCGTETGEYFRSA